MPIRRGMGGLSSGAGGNLFDRPGFFDFAEIDSLVLNADLLLKTAKLLKYLALLESVAPKTIK